MTDLHLDAVSITEQRNFFKLLSSLVLANFSGQEAEFVAFEMLGKTSSGPPDRLPS